jgi:glutamine cyclotransferase
MKKSFLFTLCLASFACNNEKSDDPEIPQPDSPKTISYSILATYPHDTASYTQGLVVYKGELYEGTGNYGASRLKKVDLKTGRTLREISLEDKFFGEGITILRDTVYQLTWKENKVFVYTLDDFRKVKEFGIETEGWGLTNDGQHLIVSTGGSDLFFYDPTSFKLLKTQTVTEAGSPSFNLNELEYIDGYVYANQYEYPYILKIDPSNGKVVARVNLDDVWKRIRSIEPKADVPNGIAWDSAAKKLYITGKWWPELYEVQLSN